MDKKKTIKSLDLNYIPSAVEEEVLKGWKENETFEKSVEARSASNSYRFYDGPPFVTGKPHYGHLLGSIVKDVIPRFQTMKGKRVERVWGWDCHGLPAENKVEKELGINSKKEIEELGIDKFVSACKSYVGNVSAEWEWYIDHIGRWVDFKNAYRTMDMPYMESVLWVFKELFDKGFIYKGKRVSLFCPRCSTPISNFEVAMDNSYKDVTDPSVFIKFKLKDQDASILAWTTTPWTLPSNFALGFSSDSDYAQVEHHGENLIMAKDRLKEVLGDEYKILREFKGRELEGKEYEPLYHYYPSNNNDYHLYSANFVSMEDGTGIVHIAPGFGEDDTQLGKEHGLSMAESVDDTGMMDPIVEVAQGKYFKGADKFIITDLENRGLMYKSTKITHSYPHCHRCETPLLYKAQTAWYIDIQKVKKQLKDTNSDINWVPEFFKHGRFELGIDSAPDWCISRTRYWGAPIPVWECICGEKIVAGSISDIEKLSGQKISDLHRPDIDRVTLKCPKCGQQAKRVPEVLDSWVEAASMPYAQVHYPFENEQKFKNNFPADFITEYTGQLRAWFYVTHVISNLLFDSIAFKNVIVTGVIQGNDGRKMSKNYGNFPDPKEAIEKYGADSLRLYLMGSPIVLGQDIAISESDWANELKTTLMLLWNSYKYFVTYASLEDWELKVEFTTRPTALDAWILTRLDQTILDMDESLSSYQIPKSVAALKSFVDDLSTWYIRRSRDRVGPGSLNIEDKEIAYTTMATVFKVFLRTSAPIIPFISEYLYRHLTGEESVHLEDWPEVNDRSVIDTELLSKMSQVRKIAEMGNASRKALGIATKQPLSQINVSGNFSSLKDEIELLQLIKDELNVDEVVLIDSKEQGIEFDTQITDQLRAKGKARELVREIQEARKLAGCRLDERIDVELPDWPKESEEEIKRKTLVDNLVKGDTVKIKRHP